MSLSVNFLGMTEAVKPVFVTCHHELLGSAGRPGLVSISSPANPFKGCPSPRLLSRSAATQTTKPTASLVTRLQKCSYCLLYLSAKQWVCHKRLFSNNWGGRVPRRGVQGGTKFEPTGSASQWASRVRVDWGTFSTEQAAVSVMKLPQPPKRQRPPPPKRQLQRATSWDVREIKFRLREVVTSSPPLALASPDTGCSWSR